MRRNSSNPDIPPLTPTSAERGYENERGYGLADLHGQDPLGRRLEREKQEKYAQELRNQMHKPGSSPGLPPVRHIPGSPASRCSTPPPPAPGGGQPPPPTSWRTSSADRPHGTPHQNRDAADKVAQLQEIMGERIRAISEQQRCESERLHSMIEQRLADVRGSSADAEQQNQQLQAAIEAQKNQFKHVEETSTWAADGVEVLKREIAELREDFAENIRKIQQKANLAQDPDFIRLEQRVTALEEEVSRLKIAFGHLEVESRAQFDKLGAALERAEAGTHEKLERLGAALDKVEAGSHDQFDEVKRVLAQHQAWVKGQHADFGRQIEEVQAEANRKAQDVQEHISNSLQQLMDKQAHKMKAALSNQQDELARRIEEQILGSVQQQVDKQMQKMKGALKAAPVVHEPVSPAPKPAPAPVVNPSVPEAFGYLRGGDEESHVLRSKRISVGRGAACDVRITHSQCVSNSHASIEFSRASGAILQDQGSRNGTFVNDRRVPEPGGCGLQSGDQIKFGVDGPEFVFEYGPASSMSGAPAVSKAERGSEIRSATPPRGRSATPPRFR